MLSQVLEDLEVLVYLLTTRACEAEAKVEQLQHWVTKLQAAYDRSTQDHTLAAKAKQDLENDAVKRNKVELCPMVLGAAVKECFISIMAICAYCPCVHGSGQLSRHLPAHSHGRQADCVSICSRAG